jgi:RNA polymerase sigma factor for flagellar operon FliA
MRIEKALLLKAMLEYLRKISNLCRTTVKQKQNTDKAKRVLELKLGRFPNADEIAKELKITSAEFSRWEQNFAANQNQSIDEVTEVYGDFILSVEPNVEDKIFNGELKKYLRQAIGQLLREKIELELV